MMWALRVLLSIQNSKRATAEEPRLGPWIQKARPLAEDFRMHELRALLAAPEAPGASP